MKFIKEADARAKEKELKDKKTEAIKKEAVKKAREIERKNKMKEVNEMVTRLKILPAWLCQSHVTKWP